MKTAVIYARYSSERQTEQSIEGQLRVCNDYAERNDIVVLDTYIDRAMTGTNDNRTDFQRMLRDSNKRAWDIVLVYKLDRFSRNKYEMAMHKKTLRDNGVKLVSCMENIPDSPEGIILESLLEGMAEYYSAELSQKVKRGMNETRQKGNFTGGLIIFGYRVENKKVVINEDEAEIVRKMFQDCASGKSIKSIIEELHQKGILYRGKPFARNTVYHLLQNEKYIGIHRHGDEVFTNIYPPIVPNDIFQEVKIKAENNKYGKHKENVYYLLRNKLKCGYCGHTVNSDSGTARSGEVLRYYKCSGKRLKNNCTLTPVRKEEIEHLVVDAILKALDKPETVFFLAEKVVEARKKKNKDNSLLNILTSQYSQIEKAISNILDCMEQGISTSSTKARLEELENKKTVINEQILIEKNKQKKQFSQEDIAKYIISMLRKQPRQMVDALIKEVRLWNNKIEIDLHYTDKRSPDGKDRWGFLFYTKEAEFTVNNHQFKSKDRKCKFKIKLYV